MKTVVLNKPIPSTNLSPSRTLIVRSLITKSGDIYRQLREEVTESDNVAVHFTTASKVDEKRVFYLNKDMVSHFIIGDKDD